MFGDERCKCCSQSCNLIYATELLKEAFLSKGSLFVQQQYKFSWTMEMTPAVACQAGEKSMQCVQGSWLSL